MISLSNAIKFKPALETESEESTKKASLDEWG